MPKQRLIHSHASAICYRTVILLSCLFVLSFCAIAQENEKSVFSNSSLTKGFDMGVDSSEHKKDWVARELGYMKVSFPAYQEWGAVFITVGKPRDRPRPFIDLSTYKTLSIEMRGELGGEAIEVGVKSNIQPDTGEETKVTVKLTPEWKTYSFPLEEFPGTDLKHLYVVAEFVYNDKTPQTVYFRNIKYVK